MPLGDVIQALEEYESLLIFGSCEMFWIWKLYKKASNCRYGSLSGSFIEENTNDQKLKLRRLSVTVLLQY